MLIYLSYFHLHYDVFTVRHHVVVYESISAQHDFLPSCCLLHRVRHRGQGTRRNKRPSPINHDCLGINGNHRASLCWRKGVVSPASWWCYSYCFPPGVRKMMMVGGNRFNPFTTALLYIHKILIVSVLSPQRGWCSSDCEKRRESLH